ncbi:MAG: alpha/beta hydrolase fold domain-containing protein [Deltaproteobacteria bacterium]|nr:alpha/beta hydrolase fold domain-containing protein [Deltaproteobacteria bacterium]
MPSWQTHMVNGLLRLAVKHRTFRDLRRIRKKVEKLDSRWSKMPADVSANDEVIEDLSCRWIRVPESRPSYLILYFHGGAFCLRTPKGHSAFLARLCRGVGATGLMPDYRLAPEHPFPAAPEDCFRIYRWLLSSGYDPMKIIVAGDSAGGGLTLSTLVQIRDAGIPNPIGGVMFSPATDMTLSGESFGTNLKKDAMFTLPNLLKVRTASLRSN